MRRSKTTTDWTKCLCRICGDTFDERLGSRIWYPSESGMPNGVRRVLCSRRCALEWYAQGDDQVETV